MSKRPKKAPKVGTVRKMTLDELAQLDRDLKAPLPVLEGETTSRWVGGVSPRLLDAPEPALAGINPDPDGGHLWRLQVLPGLPFVVAIAIGVFALVVAGAVMLCGPCQP